MSELIERLYKYRKQCLEVGSFKAHEMIGKAIKALQQKDKRIAELEALIKDHRMYLQAAIDFHVYDQVVKQGIDPPKMLEVWAVGGQQFLDQQPPKEQVS
jgi:dsDNA-specific endonuclease/ATPase MutS2